MPRKTSEQTPLKTDTKTFLKLIAKRDAILKVITRQEKKLARVNSQLANFADWLKTLTAAK